MSSFVFDVVLQEHNSLLVFWEVFYKFGVLQVTEVHHIRQGTCFSIHLTHLTPSEHTKNHSSMRVTDKKKRCSGACRPCARKKTRGLPLVLFEPACDIDGLGCLPLRLRGRPTFRDIACARLANNMKQGEVDHPRPFTRLHEVTAAQEKVPKDDPARPHGAHHAIRVACLCFCLAFPLRGRLRCFRSDFCARLANATAPLRKIGLAGDTDVAIDIEVAVGILVDFDSANQALTCHIRPRTRSHARCQQDSLQHHKRLLISKRNSDGPRFYTPNEGSGAFSFARQVDTRTSRSFRSRLCG